MTLCMPLALAAALAFGASAALAPSGSAASSLPCLGQPENVGKWTPLPAPGADYGLAVEQADLDSCTLFAPRASGIFRTRDGGATWVRTGGQQHTFQLFAEGLNAGGGHAAKPTLVATVDSFRTIAQIVVAVAQVVVSDDDGTSFTAAQWATSNNNDAAPVLGQVKAARAVTSFTNGAPTRRVYLALEQPSMTPGPAPAGTTRLIRSDDGGHTFAPVPGAAALSPTAVAVNGSAPDEIWVNSTNPGSDPTGNSGTGGLWVSRDGGDTFNVACCQGRLVHDMAVTPARAGQSQILAATADGLVRSVNSGRTWTTVSRAEALGVRTPVDNADVALVQTASTVSLFDLKNSQSRTPAGLTGCPEPSRLRANAVVPATFLVDCRTPSGVTTYAISMQRYDLASVAEAETPRPSTSPEPSVPMPNEALRELAQFALPLSNTQSGAIAFDGTRLYYDSSDHRVRAIDARTGKPVASKVPAFSILSLTVDLRRNRLLVNTRDNHVDAYDPASGRLVRSDPGVPKEASYDASFDGLSWIPELGKVLMHTPAYGAPYTPRRHRTVCTLEESPTRPRSGPNAPLVPVRQTSTWVAAGDGGGYIQHEDDMTLERVDAHCKTVRSYTHRVFSESQIENDGLACDTQTFFPAAAVWIRDSLPGTVSAYGVPAGYCPMPSRINVELGRPTLSGEINMICATLRNHTTGLAAFGRGLAFVDGGVVVARATTDPLGHACIRHAVATTSGPRGKGRVTVHFAGDAALYPTSSARTVEILRSLPAAPPVPPVTGSVPPPPPVSVPPPPAPGPLAQPGNVPAPNSAPNTGHAPAGQSQSVSQAVAAPQRQEQPQLVFARAAAQLTAAENSTSPMSTLRTSGQTARASVGCIALMLLAAAAATSLATARDASGGP
jgi:hypothetical protein